MFFFQIYFEQIWKHVFMNITCVCVCLCAYLVHSNFTPFSIFNFLVGKRKCYWKINYRNKLLPTAVKWRESVLLDIFIWTHKKIVLHWDTTAKWNCLLTGRTARSNRVVLICQWSATRKCLLNFSQNHCSDF